MNEKFKNLGRVLSKNEQRKIGGGKAAPGTCSYHGTITSNGGAWANTVNEYGTCAEQSAAMNQLCVTLISDGYLSDCHYDCGCDGWGH